MHEIVKITDQKQALDQLKCLMGAMVGEGSLKKVFYPLSGGITFNLSIHLSRVLVAAKFRQV